jgi:hypothetical protein
VRPCTSQAAALEQAQGPLAHVYTLEPPPLPERDPVDAFLFETQLGFCEHFAAAFVSLMRAAGVPARVVAGYQGGEVNPVNRTVIVNQFDAPAWAEVRLAGDGWVRVDPTAAVSPERIEWGLEPAMAQGGSFLSDSPLSPLRYRGVAWINMLRLRYDALTYRWQSCVVGFNRDQQFQLLSQVFNGISARKFVLVLLGSGLLILGLVAFSLLRKRGGRGISEVERYYLRFCDRLARVGATRHPGEAPVQFAARAARPIRSSDTEIERVTALYMGLAYAGGADPAASKLAEFRRSVQRFNPARG